MFVPGVNQGEDTAQPRKALGEEVTEMVGEEVTEGVGVIVSLAVYVGVVV